MKKRLWELGKSLVILLLIVSLLFLTAAALPAEMIRSTPWLSTLLQPIAPLLGLSQAELTYVEEAGSLTDAAQPLMISVRNSSGRATAQWDFTALDTAYETLGGMLGEALDTAGAFTTATPRQVQTALSGESACFDFRFRLPSQLLASWLDAGCRDDAPSGMVYVLAIEDGQVNLYLSGGGSYRAATLVSASALEELLEQFKPDGSQFAFEAGTRLSALTVIPGQAPSVAAGTGVSPCDNRYMEALATELGFNPYDETRYTDSSGVTYFSETNCSLQISADGAILLTSSSADRFQAAGTSLEILVEQARSLIEVAVGDTLGDARLYLSGVTQSGTATVCTFDYILGGIPVSYGKDAAACVTFDGPSVTELRLQTAGFSLTGDTLKIMPPAQAMAILPDGGKLELEYRCAYSGSLSAGWKK